MQALLALLPKVFISLASSLLTEAFLKKMIIFALEKLVKKTETDVDDKLLQEAKKVWEQ